MVFSITKEQLARALEYPYRIPATHFTFDPKADATRPFSEFSLVESRIAGRDGEVIFYDLSVLIDGEPQAIAGVCPVVAAGSNAAPEQLSRKFHGSKRPIQSLLCDFSGVVPVYSAHFSRYGAISGFLSLCPGARSRLFVSLFTAAELDLMHPTEAVGTNFTFVPLGQDGCSLAGRELGLKLFFYDSMHGPVLNSREQPIVLSSFEVDNCRFPAMGEPEILRAALKMLFPGETFEQALGQILSSKIVRSDATKRLKSIRIGVDG